MCTPRIRYDQDYKVRSRIQRKKRTTTGGQASDHRFHPISTYITSASELGQTSSTPRVQRPQPLPLGINALTKNLPIDPRVFQSTLVPFNSLKPNKLPPRSSSETLWIVVASQHTPSGNLLRTQSSSASSIFFLKPAKPSNSIHHYHSLHK